MFASLLVRVDTANERAKFPLKGQACRPVRNRKRSASLPLFLQLLHYTFTAMSPPTYEPILQEKPPPLEQDVSVSKEELIEPSSSSQPRPHLLSSSSSLRSFLLALMWTLCILTFASIVFFGGGACMGKPSSGRVGSSVQETVNEFVVDKELFGNWKWWEKRAIKEDEGEYSTSTLRDGSTQTFVFTTRPIVRSLFPY